MLSPSPWLVRLCGELRVEGEGGCYGQFPTRRSGMLLARLALSLGQTIFKDDLCRLLWSDENVSTSRVLLRNELSRLRKALGRAPEYLRTNRTSVWLDPKLATTDLAVAQALIDNFDPSEPDAEVRASRALELVQPPLFAPDLWLADAHAWRQALFKSAVSGLAQAACSHDCPAAAPLIAQALDTCPTDEAVALLGMQWNIRQGRPVEAVRIYKAVAEALDAELGAVPGEALSRLVEGVSRKGETLPSNLMQGLSPLIGRDKEIQEILATPCRLLTLSGPGGIGKTRLAIELGHRLREKFEERIWVFDLSNVVRASEILDNVLDELEIERNTRADLPKVLAGFIAQEPTLLILDNFEQVEADGAKVIEALLGGSPSLRLVITSRRRLGVTGERFFVLSPLDTDASIDLYLQSSPETSADDDLRELVGLLDGIPLAINLAASYGQVLSPRDSIGQMKSRFEFLVDQDALRPTRHQKLWDTIEWGFQLLDSETQTAFLGLAVFRGGWTLAAAEEVLQLPAAHRVLERLVSSSFVVSTQTERGIRFSLFETLREFAESRLKAEDRSRLAQRHFEYFRDFLDQTCSSAVSHIYRKMTRALPADYANLREAYRWALENDPAAAITMAHRLYVFWQMDGLHTDGLVWLREALSKPYQASVDALGANFGAGILALAQGLVPEARRHLERAMEIGVELEDQLHFHIVMGRLSEVDRLEGRYQKAETLCRETLRFFSKEEDHYHRTFIHAELAFTLCHLDRLDEARAEAEKVVRYRMTSQHGPLLAQGLSCLGRILIERTEYQKAEELLAQAMERYRADETSLGQCQVLELRVEMDLDLRRFTMAEARLQELERLLVRLGNDSDLDRVGRLRARWLLGTGRYEEAAILLYDALKAETERTLPQSLNLLDNLALLHRERNPARAGAILSDGNRLRSDLGMPRLPSEKHRLASILPSPTTDGEGEVADSLAYWWIHR